MVFRREAPRTERKVVPEHLIKFCEDCGQRIIYRPDPTSKNGFVRAHQVSRRKTGAGNYIMSSKPHQCPRTYIKTKTYSTNKEMFIG